MNLVHARTPNGQLAAMVRHDNVSMYSSATAWARRLDLPSGRLVEIDPGRVDCLDEFLGV